MNRKSKWLIAVLVVLMILFISAALFPLFFPWTKMNCKILYVDISSGRVKRERYMLGIQLYSSQEETEFSKKLFPDHNYPDPEWRMDSYSDPFQRHSPHYEYHGAVFLLSEFEGEAGEFLTQGEAEKQQMRWLLLQNWQKDGPKIINMTSIKDLKYRQSAKPAPQGPEHPK